MTQDEKISQLEADWKDSPRWKGIKREYSAADLMKLRGSVVIEHTLARLGAEKLWRLVNQEKPLCALGALTGNQAIQEIQAAGFKFVEFSDLHLRLDDELRYEVGRATVTGNTDRWTLKFIKP